MGIIIGLIVFWVIVPIVLTTIGMFFLKDMGRRTFSNGVTVDNYELPDWLKWLQNPEDNLTGDKRGSYWCEDRFRPKLFSETIWQNDTFRMWWWTAIRNTWKYLKMVILGCDIRKFKIYYVGSFHVRDDLASQGFQIVIAWPNTLALPRFGIYWVKEIKNGKGICFQLFWKIAPKHNVAKYRYDWDYFKGLTFELNPWKDLG
jgi:hypothetical protein